MRYALVITIQGLPKTTNSGGRAHWALKAKEARKWKSLVFLSIPKTDLPPAPLKKARLVLTRFSSGRIDADGLASSFKHVIDGLVAARVLEDDSMEHIGMPEYRVGKAKPGKGFIRVEVYA